MLILHDDGRSSGGVDVSIPFVPNSTPNSPRRYSIARSKA